MDTMTTNPTTALLDKMAASGFGIDTWDKALDVVFADGINATATALSDFLVALGVIA